MRRKEIFLVSGFQKTGKAQFCKIQLIDMFALTGKMAKIRR